VLTMDEIEPIMRHNRQLPETAFKGGIRKPSRANASHDSPNGA